MSTLKWQTQIANEPVGTHFVSLDPEWASGASGIVLRKVAPDQWIMVTGSVEARFSDQAVAGDIEEYGGLVWSFL